MPTESELIAGNKTIPEIAEYMDADSLTYATLGEIKESLKKETFCAACLTGEYPYPISKAQKQELIVGRQKFYG